MLPSISPPFADHKLRGTQLAIDPAENLSRTLAFDIADNRHAGPDA
jgi:hypothetical protein